MVRSLQKQKFLTPFYLFSTGAGALLPVSQLGIGTGTRKQHQWQKEEGGAMLIPHMILMDMPVKDVPAGTVLLKEGETGTEAYILREGEVVVEMGGSEITSVSERGTIFGEMSSILGRKRGASVTTTMDSSFFVIDDLMGLLGNNPKLTLQLLKLMTERVDEMNFLVTDKKEWWSIF